jgi:hypothetical protein
MLNLEDQHNIESHYERVIDAIIQGRVVPFLGADINLCGRPRTADGKVDGWQPNYKYPPSNRELALYLDACSGYRERVSCPFCSDKTIMELPEECPLRQEGKMAKMALQHVSQYVDLKQLKKQDLLYGTLDHLFKAKYSPNPVHRFFAKLPQLMRDKGYSPPYQLIVTTCFDNTLEQAFEAAGEEFDLVSYVGGVKGGQFEHQTPDGLTYPIEEGNQSLKPCLADRPIILKLYGRYGEKCIITEDHYIDYLAHGNISNLLPAPLLDQLRASCIWFLGYNLNYWNLRVILHRIWSEEVFSSNKTWWAIHSDPEALDQEMWEQYHGLLLRMPLKDYFAELTKLLRKHPRQTRPAAPAMGVQPRHTRNQIFISYSHKDKKWLTKFQSLLSPAVQAGAVSVWSDTQIKPGTKWKEAIQTALASAKVAVLLVSQNFLDSEFITKEELPPLLEASEQEGLTIFWVYLSNCLYDYSAIADYQAAHDISKPLNNLTKAAQEKALTDICHKILATSGLKG